MAFQPESGSSSPDSDSSEEYARVIEQEEQLRDMIYEKVLCQTRIEDTALLQLSVDLETAIVTWRPLLNLRVQRVLQGIDLAAYRALNLQALYEKAAIQDCLRREVHKTLFVFEQPEHLLNFTTLLARLHAFSPFEVHLCIRMIMFKDDAIFGQLSGWELLEMAHGDRFAEAHVQAWVSAMKHMPFICDIHIILNRPWRDTWRLKEVISPLRAHIRGLPVVWVKRAHWQHLPHAMLHIAMTVAAIRGETLTCQTRLSDDEKYMWLRHGCRDKWLERHPHRRTIGF